MNLRLSLVVAVSSLSSVVAFHTGCRSALCRNGGICVPEADECSCPDGVTGQYCEIDMRPQFCQNDADCLWGGTCVDDSCVCQSGITGAYCEEIAYGLCVNGGTFVDGGCQCPSEFTGAHCELTMDTLCVNGGTFMDGGCQCPSEFTGAHCELTMDTHPGCENGGTLVRPEDGSPAYCVCPYPTSGEFCQNECFNGGTYVDISKENCNEWVNGRYVRKTGVDACNVCLCADGYIGDHCEDRKIMCDAANSAEPYAAARTGCTCISSRYTGLRCETDLCTNGKTDPGEDGADCGSLCGNSCVTIGSPLEPFQGGATIYGGATGGNLQSSDNGDQRTQVVQNADGSVTLTITGSAGGEPIEVTVVGGAGLAVLQSLFEAPPGLSGDGQGAPWVHSIAVTCDGTCSISVQYNQPTSSANSKSRPLQSGGQKYGQLGITAKGGIKKGSVDTTATDSSISADIGLTGTSSKFVVQNSGSLDIRPLYGSSSADDKTDVIVVTVLLVIAFVCVIVVLFVVYGCYRKNSSQAPGSVKGNDPYVEQYAVSPQGGGEQYAYTPAVPQIEA